MSGDAEFSTAAELALSVPDSELRKVRDEIESSIGSVPVSVEGGRAGAASAATDGGGVAALATLQEDTVDLLEEIEDDLSGGGGLGGGGGGGGGFDPLSFLAGRGLGGGGAASGGLFRFLGAASAGTAVASGQLGRGGRLAPGGEEATGAEGPFGMFIDAFRGAQMTADAATSPLQTFFGRPDAPTDSELPGNITRETILQNRRQGDTPFSGDDTTRNRADERRNQTTNPTINVDVTVEQTRQALEQAVRDAKRQAAREVAQEVNKNIPGTTSRTGL